MIPLGILQLEIHVDLAQLVRHWPEDQEVLYIPTCCWEWQTYTFDEKLRCVECSN